MSNLTDFVTLSIVVNDVGITRDGFGIPLILSYTANWVERTREYTSLLAVASDFSTTSAEYIAANAVFEQSPHPSTVVIGRGANKPTQAYQINVASVNASYGYVINVAGPGITTTSLTITTTSGDLSPTAFSYTTNLWSCTAHGMNTGDGPYRLATSGTLPAGFATNTNYWVINADANDFKLASSKANALSGTPVTATTNGTAPFTLQRVQNDVICALIVQALNGVTGATYTAAEVPGAGETAYVTVTANTAGAFFSLAITQFTSLSIKQTHADPGIAADLNAILLENQSWYTLYTMHNSSALVLAAAAWTEAQNLMYFPDVAESNAINTVLGTGTDTIDQLNALTYNRTAISWHPNPIDCFGAGFLGAVLPLDPGTDNWSFKNIAGIAAPSLTTTQIHNVHNKNGNIYRTAKSRNFTWEGTVSGGTFGWIDVTRGLDWLQDDMTSGILGLFVGNSKIPYTDGGIQTIVSEMESSLKTAERMGIINSGWTVIFPTLGQVSSSSKTIRQLTGLGFQAVLTGSIDFVGINGTVSF